MATREIDEKILSEIEKTGVVRRKDLLESLKARYGKEKGFSGTSLNRKIGELISEDRIKVLGSEEFSEYGIADEDKRAKYLVSSTYVSKKRHVDSLIGKASIEDFFENQLILKELYRSSIIFPLNPAQLSGITDFLGHHELTDELGIKIVHDNILKQRFCMPEDLRDSLTESLARLVEKYRRPLRNQNKQYILDILGLFSTEEVIVWVLEEDLKTLEEDKELLSKKDLIMSEIKDVYHSKYLIHIFEESKDDLLRLMWEYNEKGKEKGHEDERKIALVLDNILDYAVENREKAVYYEKLCGVRK